jgi:pimeloyl-ACP methyl ester carboxylesterase
MLEEKTFDTGTVSVNYGEGPASGPPLVLLHGAGGRWLSFVTVIPQLIGDWHIYALDHRGHGPSGRVPGAYRFLDYARDAVAFVQNQVPEPAYLWGQSLGANVSVAVAAQAPESVRAVVLEEPGIDPEDIDRVEAQVRQMRELASSGRSAEELLPYVAGMTIELPGHDAPVRMGDVAAEGFLRVLADCMSQLEPEVMDFILDRRLLEGWDLDALLRQVSCPALFLQGDAAFGGLEDEPVQRAVSLLPRGQHIKIHGAGHNVHNTQPEAALQAAVQFFKSI